MQRPAAHQLAARIRDHEIAHVLRHLEFGARQHDPFRRVAVNELEQSRDIVHRGFANLDAFVRGGLVFDEVGCEGTDHFYSKPQVIIAVYTGSSESSGGAMIRVPMASSPLSSNTRCTTNGSEPFTIRTSCTPFATASDAAFSFACMPPEATPDSISSRHSAVVST